jgi:hypothetical protein
MDIPGQSMPEPIPGNDGADRMHNAEQMYAEASHQLDKVIEYAASAGVRECRWQRGHLSRL